MLTSLAIILISGMIFGYIFSKMRLPSLIGMIIAGIIISPHALNLIDDSVLMIAKDLRQIALIIILTRAGLSLNLDDLKRVGRPALLMCFIPASIEMISIIILAPIIFKISYLDAAIIASVVAAVSPAVVVPRMIKLIDDGYGKKHSIPQLILASASVDDVFVIVIFTALMSLSTTGNFSIMSIVQVPTSILLGIILGVVVGMIIIKFFDVFKVRDVIKVLIILCVSFLLIQLQTSLENVVLISSLLSIMSMGITIKYKRDDLAKNLAIKYNQLWLVAEIVLFVLVGATVNLKYAYAAGISVFILVVLSLVFRMFGVSLCLIKSKLTKNEKFFCMIAYTPKATVQAAIGAIPLTMGLECGELVLTVAVLSILITAPFGAIGIDNTYKKLLADN